VPTFVEVLKVGSAAVVKKVPIVGDRFSGRKVVPVEQCDLDLLPAVRVLDADLRSALDCSTLESFSFDLLGKDHPLRPLGKTYLPHASLKFEISKLRTWSKRVIGFNKVLGRATKKLLGWLARYGPRRKGLRLGRLMPKPSSSRSSSFMPETTLVASSGLCEDILPESMMEFPYGDPLCEDRPRGGSSLVKPAPPFVFPPLPTAALTELLCGAELSVSAIPSPLGASELGKKIRSSPSPLLQSRPFQHYYRRARELRVGHSVFWE
jgi:hypothetical protein